MSQEKPTVYLSVDVIADGYSPLFNNLLSIGIWGFNKSGEEVIKWERNLFPRPNKKCDPNTIVNSINQFPDTWKRINTNRVQPNVAFDKLHSILCDLQSKYNIEWLLSHISCWQWINCYYYELVESNPEKEWLNIEFEITCFSNIWNFYVKQQKLTKEQENDLWHYIGNDVSNTIGTLACAKMTGKQYHKLLHSAGMR